MSKYRAWDKELKNYQYSGWGHKNFDIFVKRVNCDRFILERFIKRKTKENIDIYEGDIVKHLQTGDIGVIKEIDGSFVMGGEFDSFYGRNVKIIGNIHENPELLEQTK